MRAAASVFRWMTNDPRTIAVYALLVLWCAIAFSLAIAEIATVVSLVFWLIWRFREGIVWPQIRPVIFAPLAAYVLICLVSLVWTESPKESYRGIFKVLKYAVMFWMGAEIFEWDQARKKFETVFCLFYAVLVVDGFVQYLFGRDLLRWVALQDASAGPRVSASFKSFGLLASYLIATLPYLGALCVQARRQGRRLWFWIYLFSALGGTVLLILTRSRGAVLAFLIGWFLFLILTRKFKWFAVSGLLALSLLFVIPKSMIIHQNAEGEEQSLVERYYLWDRAVHVIKARPWTGTGINTYVATHAKYDRTQNWRVRDYYAHNGYLQAAAETGVPSILFLLVCIGSYFFRSCRAGGCARGGGANNLVCDGLLLGLANFLMLTLVDTVFHNPQAVMVFWYLLGLQLAYAERGDKSSMSFSK